MNTEQYVTPKTTAPTTDASATSAPATTAARPRKTLTEKMAALEQQKARLAQRAAALSKEARKARNGQLIAWGLWVEHYYTALAPEQRRAIQQTVFDYLTDRNLARAREGFARLDAEVRAKAQAGKGES